MIVALTTVINYSRTHNHSNNIKATELYQKRVFSFVAYSHHPRYSNASTFLELANARKSSVHR